MDSKKETAPGGQDQEQFVSRFGSTEVRITKDEITAQVQYKNHPDFQSSDDLNKQQSD